MTKLPKGRARKICRLAAIGVGPALALAVSGCGASSGADMTSTAAQPAAATQASTPKAVAVIPAAHVSILSPRSGSHTSSTVTVSVAVDGASAESSRPLRYVLDRRFTRSGSAHLTFHDVAPGRHRLEVLLASDGSSHASTTFIVRAPAPAAVATPVPAQHAPATATRPTATTPRTPTTRTPPPPPARRTPSPPPTTSSPSAPPATGGIPQGGGGDGDGDNSGAPSDGDGNL